MNVTFHGGARSVTGANYLLESEGEKILIDCGLQQGSHYAEEQNFEPFPYKPKDIDAVFVTHSHLDHIGRLPKLIKDGFKGKIYSTKPAKGFSELLLDDSEDILAREAKRHKLPMLYAHEDLDKLMKHWEGVQYHEEIHLKQFTAKLYNAGHILGSSFIEIMAKREKKTIVFSGDLGYVPAPLIKPREEICDTDYCVVESTYGNRVHNPAEKDLLEDVIEETVTHGGVLMIPAFSMERTQDLLFQLHELVRNGRIPRVPIFLDSPLAIRLTALYETFRGEFNDEMINFLERGNELFNFEGLTKALTTQESKAINDVPSPKIIIAGSGMSQGGRIIHHERRYLPDPKSTILFIGFQARGSLGRHILDGAKTVNIQGDEVAVNCRVVSLSGYSAHADAPQLLEWVSRARLKMKKIFMVQGEEDQAVPFAQKVKDELAVDTHVPSPGETVML